MLIRETCKFPVKTIVERTVLTETGEFQTVKEEKISECGQTIRIVKEIYNNPDPDLATQVIKIYACGHGEVLQLTPSVKDDSQRNPILWNRLLPYQKESVRFLEKTHGRALLAHDVGLGKTVITLSYLRENKEELLKGICLIVTPAGDIFRWKNEALEWLGLTNGFAAQNLTSLEEFDLRLFPSVYYRSGQELSKIGNIIICSWTRLSDDNLINQIKERGLSCVILDESHMYKNEGSKRTRSLVDLIKWADKTNGKQTPVIFLTATPITNKLAEYTTTLNILDPKTFPNKDAVLSWCHYDWTTRKYLGLQRNLRDRFFSITTKYIMRKTAEQVHLPLPKKEVIYEKISVNSWESNKQFIQEYNKVLDLMESELLSSKPNSGYILGYMSQLRRYTGFMKILSIAEKAYSLLNSGHQKITIGVHHVDVRESLVKLLENWNPLSMSTEDPAEKDAIEEEFKKNPERRVLVVNTTSAGQGRNLQFCKTAILGERLWNQKLEEQFFGRFHRIIRNEDGTVKTEFTDEDTVRIFILSADCTFDEYFDAMVKLKGGICNSADELAEEPDSEFLIELAKLMVAKRMEYVGV